MSIASEMTNLAANRDAIKAAIEARSPTVAPTNALSSFPASIASIPSGGGWEKPSDWPDLHELLKAYPSPDPSQVNTIAVLLDLRGVTTVKIDGGGYRAQSFRYSDDPQVVHTDARAYIHTFSGSPSLGWCIAYSSNPISISMRWDMFGYLGTDATGYGSYAGLVLWTIGIGNAEMYGESSSVQCIESDILNLSNGKYVLERAKQIQIFSGATTGTNAGYLFQNNIAITELDVSELDVSDVTMFEGMFTSCSAISKLDTSKWDMSSAINVNKIFENCFNLTSVDMSGWDLSSVTTMDNAFYQCGSLRTIVGGKSVSSDGSIDGSTEFFGKGPNADFGLNYSTWLDHDSLLFLMYWIPDLSGSTARTLSLGSANLSKLTVDEKAVATAKNWTIS